MLLLCCLSVVSWGQKDKWMLYPAEVDFDAGPGFVPYNFSSPSSGLGAPYVVENSVFGENGELYFYIQNASIYDKDGVFYGNFSEPGLIKKEIGIAPVPGMCRTYCIFFIEALASATMCFKYGGATDDVYALPDQIDGEGDDLFFGIAPIYVTSLSINQAPLPASYSAVPSFSDFDPIGLAITYQGIATSYSINIVSVDIVTGEPVFGPGYLDYQSSYTGAPPASIDLRCLEGPALCDLFDGYAGQPFLLTVTVSGRCLYEGKASGYFQLFAPMAHPVAYDGSGRGCSLTPSASVVRSIAPSGGTGAAYAYPNPTVGELNLSLPMPEGGDVALKIFDSSGRLILLREGYMERGAALWRLSLAGHPAGAYYYQLQTSGSSFSGKLVKL